MANVLVQESSLQAIAAAIRLKNGSAATYTPSQMAAAIEAITGGGGSPASLGSKTIKINGTFQASSDGVDGFSDVTIDVHPGILEPYSEDLSTGYVDTGVWKLSGTNCFSDVYEVEANTAYVVALGGVVGTRFRVMFCTDDPTIASSNITGTSITNINNPTTCFIFARCKSTYMILSANSFLGITMNCITHIVNPRTIFNTIL